jgi:hypothetical protein
MDKRVREKYCLGPEKVVVAYRARQHIRRQQVSAKAAPGGV